MGKSSQNIAKELDPKEAAFVEAYSTPPYPSIAKAGEAAGYSPKYAYALAQRPEIKAAIRERTAAIREQNETVHERLLQKLGDIALESDGEIDGLNAARLFFQGMNVGQGGVKVVTNINNTAGAVEERIARLDGILSDDTGEAS